MSARLLAFSLVSSLLAFPSSNALASTWDIVQPAQGANVDIDDAVTYGSAALSDTEYKVVWKQGGLKVEQFGWSWGYNPLGQIPMLGWTQPAPDLRGAGFNVHTWLHPTWGFAQVELHAKVNGVFVLMDTHDVDLWD